MDILEMRLPTIDSQNLRITFPVSGSHKDGLLFIAILERDLTI